MATIRKRTGKRGTSYQAIVVCNGTRVAESKPTKAEAKAWAENKIVELRAKQDGEIPPGKTFGDLLARYRDEIVVKKRGAKWESNRIDAWIRNVPIARRMLTELDAVDADNWIKQREAEVSASTVLRELTILSHACTMACRPAWRWLKHNPFKDIERPKMPAARTRRPSPQETEAILIACGCDPQITPVTAQARVGYAYLFAIETGMRAGEIVGLRWKDIKGRVAYLPMTKNGHPRAVPLTQEAGRLVSLLPHSSDDTQPIFQLTSQQLDALFRKAMKRAMVEDMHFHDTRREALTRLASKVDVMTLAKISGHRDLRILQNTYYAPDMQGVAPLLD